jgi:GTP-binding protein Era
VPYSCEVRIDRFREKSEKLSVIEATIVVSRESQKGIIIGTQGAALKDLGIKSRKRLEEFLDRGIYLDLRVKVDKNWRESKEALAAYGYVEDN